jgi:ribonuclease P protein component
MNYGFSKKEKLKSRKLIGQLFEDGKIVSKFPLKLFYVPAQFDDGAKVKAAVSVSKRNFKTAVDRNRIKRLLRESYRLNKHLVTENITENYAFLILYVGRDLPEFKLLERKMQLLLKEFLATEVKSV